jgi:type II secretory pathway pseudopilin PulG
MRNPMRESIRRNRRRMGITLIEMMVAMAISLLMMAAVAQLFASVSASVSASRASITLSESLRAASKKLQGDLSGVTATMQPPLRPELGGGGYFEAIEGPNNDYSAYQDTQSNISYKSQSAVGVDTLSGDADDILMFTVRSKDGQPFVGKFYNVTTATFTAVESQMAEVVWFAVPNGQVIPITNTTVSPNTVIPVPLCTVYRRILLIAPEYQNTARTNVTPAVFFNNYDLSARFDAAYYASTGSIRMALNSLEDLTKRESRFGHDQRAAQNAFPFGVLLPPTQYDYSNAGGAPANLPQAPAIYSGAGLGSSQAITPLNPASGRVGEDVVLTNVLAFDVRVYDPAVPLMPATDSNGNYVGALNPSDGGYWTQYQTYSNSPLGYGDFVDMGYAVNTNASQLCNLYSYKVLPSATMSIFSGWPITMPGSGSSVPQWYSTGNYNSTTTSLNYLYPTYDTWSAHYDSMLSSSWQVYPFSSSTTPANFNSSGTYSVGSNGFDDDNNGIVDDPVSPPAPGIAASAGESQYPPPYPVPLRGIQVKIRTYEPDSRQVREVTVTQDFLPQ